MIIDTFLPISLIFIMFTLGAGLNTKDFKNILFEPKAFGVGIANQIIVLPIITFSLSPIKWRRHTDFICTLVELAPLLVIVYNY